MRLIWFALPAIVVIAISSYSMLASGTAIVDATVIRIVDRSQALLDTRYQLIVNATQAFPNFPLFVMSPCSHAVGEHLDVGVKVTNLLGGNKPVWDEGQFFKPGGILNIGFVPWNGCP